MAPRPDISDKLIHFTGGASHEEAFGNLCSIINDKNIRGSTHLIKGSYTCVCFTEAPVEVLSHGLLNLSDYSRYRPFGIIYDKAYVFSQGGRPVIYQADHEFDGLSESSRWRHMRYEPGSDPRTDFTWEREWRVQCNQFPVAPNLAGIVVPSDEWAQRIIATHNEQQDDLVYMYSQIMDQNLAEQYRDEFPWRFCRLA